MLELLPETSDDIVALKASGTLTKADQDAIFPQLEEILDRNRGSVRAFVDQADLVEMEKGVISEALWFDMRYWARVERIAILATKEWQDEVTRTADIFKAAQVRRFAPAERDAAWTWLRD